MQQQRRPGLHRVGRWPGCWGCAMCRRRRSQRVLEVCCCAQAWPTGTKRRSALLPRTVALPGKQLTKPAESHLQVVNPVAGSQSKEILPACEADLAAVITQRSAAARRSVSVGVERRCWLVSAAGEEGSCTRPVAHLYSWRIRTAAWLWCSRTAAAPCQLQRCPAGRPGRALPGLRRRGAWLLAASVGCRAAAVGSWER